MLKNIKSLFKKKEPEQVIESKGDKLIITTQFNDRKEVKKYKLLHSVTEFKSN